MASGKSRERQNVVVVRAGRNSLHRTWLEDRENRSWDLIVSPYDEKAAEPLAGATVLPVLKGGKWDILHRVLTMRPLAERYRYVWLPDDDLALSGADIDRMFHAMRQHALAVAQPALKAGSYFSHGITNACPGFQLRYANYVEIMGPCLRRDVFEQMLPAFAGSMSGFGIDWLWGALPGVQPRGVAILDAITMLHTRPIGTGLRPMMSAMGTSPEAELTALCERFGIPATFKPVSHAGITTDGRLIEGQRAMGLRMAVGYLSARRSFPKRRRLYRAVNQLLRRQLGPIHRIAEVRVRS